MKKIIAFIILVIIVILIISLSYNYYKNKDIKNEKLNKLKSDLETSEILNNKSSKDDSSKSDSDDDTIEVEENDTNESKSDDGESTEETNLNVPDTASNDETGYVKLDSYTVESSKSSIKVGKSVKLVVNYYPSNASEKDTLFVSETKDTCKVSSLGKVTGLKKGVCIIKVKVKNMNTNSLLLDVK